MNSRGLEIDDLYRILEHIGSMLSGPFQASILLLALSEPLQQIRNIVQPMVVTRVLHRPHLDIFVSVFERYYLSLLSILHKDFN